MNNLSYMTWRGPEARELVKYRRDLGRLSRARTRNDRRSGQTTAQSFATGLARFSHQLTVEARDRPAITSLRLLTVLNVGFKYARIVQGIGR